MYKRQRLNIRFITGVFFVLAVIISSCNSFKDEITPEKYSEVPKDIDGNWQLVSVLRNGTDITDYMDFKRFHVLLNKDNTYKLNNYLPFIVKNDGTWNVDDPIYPFHLILKEEGSEKEVKTEIGFLTVDGQRRLTITLSPGCYSNKYVYTFEQISE
mgnify:CR=1 FL=1